MAIGGPSSKAGHVDLVISGMTCASCAVRVEKQLNKMGGVSATVNFANEQAAVSYDPSQVTVEDLIGAVGSAGYQAALPLGALDDHGVLSVPLRLVVAVLGTVPIALWAWWPGTRPPGWGWAAVALATVVVGYSGWTFHRAALANARHGVATMDTLVSAGALAAWAWSLGEVVYGQADKAYFDSAALITTLVVLGRYLEGRAKRRSGAAVRALLEGGAKEAHVLKAGAEVAVPVGALRVGELFVVRPGEKVATDGVVVEGASAVDQSLLTGEDVPAEVGPGDEVVGGAVNSSGRLVVKASKVGAATALAQMARLVAEAQAGKAPAQRLADRVAAVFVPSIIGL
ncbi:MAG TPA: cation transporter, partial [Acidimicrobiales bacterium]|nr:cation transporter [Acidimicrobiales bacterium]